MGIMGWASTGMTRRYQHVTDTIRHTVADQVDGLLWDDAERDSGEADAGSGQRN